MLSKETEFTAKTFIDQVEKKLGEGRSTLAWCINAYHWAGREGHLAEIHRYAPNFSMEWLRSRIMAIFNINPSDLERAISRLGGDSPENAEKVCKVVERVGIAAVCRADAMLTPEQKKTFIVDLPEPHKITPENFREEVQKRYDDGLKKMGPPEVKEILSNGIRLDPKAENISLRKDVAMLRRENAALRKENAVLRAENGILHKKVEKIQSALGGKKMVKI